MGGSSADEPGVTTRDVAQGVGSAALARAGAVIEAVATPIYTWAYGLASFGLYTVLSAAVSLGSGSADLAMSSALQRAVPQAADEARAHAAVRHALLIGLAPSVLIGAGVALTAPAVAAVLNAAPADRPALVACVLLFALALPLTTFVEVATAAVRARRAFGPEIRLRVLWEQLVRLGLALVLAAFGLGALGLAIAHVASLVVVAALALRLLGRYYDLRLLLSSPRLRDEAGALLRLGLALAPVNAARRAMTDLPPILLNLLLPGSRGADAAGLYGIARKLSSVPQVVRTVFAYVMAPLASAQAAADRARLGQLYGFATRLSTVLVVPLGLALCAAAPAILLGFVPDARAALPLVVALVAARTVEAAAGPASAVLEMVGPPGLSLLNALVGIAAWVLLAAWLVPLHGPFGMALAVAVGIVLVAGAAVVELRVTERLAPFARPFPRAFGAALLGGLLPGAVLALPLPPLVGGVGAAAALLPGWWLAIRLGLPREDRAALPAPLR